MEKTGEAVTGLSTHGLWHSHVECQKCWWQHLGVCQHWRQLKSQGMMKSPKDEGRK